MNFKNLPALVLFIVLFGNVALATNPELHIVVANTRTNLLDQTWIAFNAAATDTFDSQFDADKLEGASNRQTIYTLGDNSDRWMSINTLPAVSTTKSVEMGFLAGSNDNFVFTFDGIGTFDSTVVLLLEDRKTNTMYNIRKGDYAFAGRVNDMVDRFVVYFTAPVNVSVMASSCTAHGAINIAQPEPGLWSYNVKDNGGATVATGTMHQHDSISIDAAPGTYYLELTDSSDNTVNRTLQIDGVEPVMADFTMRNNTIKIEASVDLTNVSMNATTYSWDFGDGTTTDEESPSHHYDAVGNYTITLTATNTNGCTSTALQYVDVVTDQVPTAIANIETNEQPRLWSYGNKVFADFSKLDNTNAEINIYNILGQQLSSEKYNSNATYTKTLDGAAGYVIASVKYNGKVLTQKLLLNATR